MPSTTDPDDAHSPCLSVINGVRATLRRLFGFLHILVWVAGLKAKCEVLTPGIAVDVSQPLHSRAINNSADGDAQQPRRPGSRHTTSCSVFLGECSQAGGMPAACSHGQRWHAPERIDY